MSGNGELLESHAADLRTVAAGLEEEADLRWLAWSLCEVAARLDGYAVQLRAIDERTWRAEQDARDREEKAKEHAARLEADRPGEIKYACRCGMMNRIKADALPTGITSVRCSGCGDRFLVSPTPLPICGATTRDPVASLYYKCVREPGHDGLHQSKFAADAVMWSS